MREELENILYEHLKTSLPAEFKSMFVHGHSTEDRRIPYITLDVGELTPFSDLQAEDGIFEAEVSIAIADSAHDINYRELFKRIRAVMNAFANFTYSDNVIEIDALTYEGESDARDDNNLGCVMTYKAIVQFL